jgi:two-component system, OmpR family, response regulator
MRATNGQGPFRVLVVDDNPDVTESLARLLGVWGFDARVAGDGDGALELVGSYRPGAILLDLELPGTDGLEVARRLRERHVKPRPLVVCMSGWSGEDVRWRCLEAGCDLHLVKPTDPETLRRLLCTRADAFAETGPDHDANG